MAAWVPVPEQVQQRAKAAGEDALPVWYWTDVRSEPKATLDVPAWPKRYRGMGTAAHGRFGGRFEGVPTHSIFRALHDARRFGPDLRDYRESEDYPNGAYDSTYYDLMRPPMTLWRSAVSSPYWTDWLLEREAALAGKSIRTSGGKRIPAGAPWYYLFLMRAPRAVIRYVAEDHPKLRMRDRRVPEALQGPRWIGGRAAMDAAMEDAGGEPGNSTTNPSPEEG